MDSQGRELDALKRLGVQFAPFGEQLCAVLNLERKRVDRHSLLPHHTFERLGEIVGVHRTSRPIKCKMNQTSAASRTSGSHQQPKESQNQMSHSAAAMGTIPHRHNAAKM